MNRCTVASEHESCRFSFRSSRYGRGLGAEMFAVVPESDDVSGAFELRSDALQLKFMVSCPRRRNQGLSAADANGSHAVVISQLRDVGKRCEAMAGSSVIHS